MVTITSGVERWSRDKVNSVPLAYDPFPRQSAFHASPAKYRLFGGAAGPGKSKALLMEAIVQAHEHPNANTLLLRRTFPELEQSLLLYFRRDVPRELYKSFHESKHVVEWLNGSTTRFGYCAAESDVYQYQGAEFLFIGIDELTLFTLRQWQFLTSRNRCPVPGAFPCMAGATNPGNIGHAWVKSLWIDKQPAPGMENPAAYDPADYDFVPARVTDNPIYAGDEQYLKTLRALPSHLKRAFLDGDWDVFAGQYFDKFDTSRHVVRAEQIFTNLREKLWLPRWISIDWGFEHPAAVYWHAAIPPTGGVGAGLKPAPTDALQREARTDTPRFAAADSGQGSVCATSRVVTYREYVTHRTPPRELAREIIAHSLHSTAAASDASVGAGFKPAPTDVPACAEPALGGRSEAPFHSGPRERTAPDSAREQIDAIYLSPDAFARRTDEASIAEQMGDVFAAAGLPRPVPADDDRVGGWMLMYQMLDADDRKGSQVDGESSLGDSPQVPAQIGLSGRRLVEPGISSSLGDPVWRITDNCIELIRTLPNLVRDSARVEDVEKMDGDDPADAARYGLKSRYAARPGDPAGWRSRMPLADRLAARVVSADPTIRAIQARKAALEESRGARPVPFAHRRR
ncbi:MAG: terminase family protein [Acidobacteriia bacterium]|nr:terminase family protein [Terriglobia bacterium]